MLMWAGLLGLLAAGAATAVDFTSAPEEEEDTPETADDAVIEEVGNLFDFLDAEAAAEPEAVDSADDVFGAVAPVDFELVEAPVELPYHLSHVDAAAPPPDWDGAVDPNAPTYDGPPTDGNDVIGGGDGDDMISGLAGDDQLGGRAGDDVLSGDAGEDRLYGEAGSDTLDGGADDDTAEGGRNDDLLRGSDGNDTLSGQSDNDVLEGGAGDDSLLGGDGDDNLTGGQGDDSLLGGLSNDTLTGGAGSDALFGGWGDDVIDGLEAETAETDFLNGGGGADTILAGAGDIVTSGGDADAIILAGAHSETDAATEILDFTTEDQLIVLYDDALGSAPTLTLAQDPDDPQTTHVMVDDVSVAEVEGTDALTLDDIALMPIGLAQANGLIPQ